MLVGNPFDDHFLPMRFGLLPCATGQGFPPTLLEFLEASTNFRPSSEALAVSKSLFLKVSTHGPPLLARPQKARSPKKPFSSSQFSVAFAKGK